MSEEVKEEPTNNGKPLFELEDVYDEKISPLMTQIIAICKEYDMPMVCKFQYCNREDEDESKRDHEL